MRKLFLIILSLILIFFLSLYFVAYTSMGANPSGQHLEEISKSSQYNKTNEVFQNPVPISISTGRPIYEVIYDYILNGENLRQVEKLPEGPPDPEELKEKSDNVRFIGG